MTARDDHQRGDDESQTATDDRACHVDIVRPAVARGSMARKPTVVVMTFTTKERLAIWVA